MVPFGPNISRFRYSIGFLRNTVTVVKLHVFNQRMKDTSTFRWMPEVVGKVSVQQPGYRQLSTDKKAPFFFRAPSLEASPALGFHGRSPQKIHQRVGQRGRSTTGLIKAIYNRCWQGRLRRTSCLPGRKTVGSRRKEVLSKHCRLVSSMAINVLTPHLAVHYR